MRRLTRIALIAACLMMVIGGFWAMGHAGDAFAADKDYTYTVKIYSGKEGHFDGGSRAVTYSGLHYGDRITIDVSQLGLELETQGEEGQKYYVRGLTIAGHDNDELSSRQYQSYTFLVKGDESFSVAYGMAGGMVKYTVYYVDEDGNDLADPRELYGMPGDFPVVSYLYIEGYTPDAYNKGKTLVEDESRNVFTFTYSKGEQPAEPDNGDNNPPNQPGNNPANNPANQPGANPNGNVNPADNANNNNQPQNFVNIDDTEGPLTNPDDAKKPDTTIEDPAPPLIERIEKLGLSLPAIIALAAAIAALIFLLIVLLIRNKNDDDGGGGDGVPVDDLPQDAGPVTMKELQKGAAHAKAEGKHARR